MKTFVFLLISAAGGLLSCSGTDVSVTKDSGALNKAFINHIKTTPSVINHQEKEMTLTGKVISNPDRTIHYVSLISGVIERTYFSLGDKVQQGQALIDIRSTELSTLHSEQLSLEAEVKMAERELKTAREMFDDTMLSEKDLLEAERKLKQAQATLGKVQSDMSLFGINKGNGTFTIKAPMSGYIIHKNASSGSTVSADSDPLFTITDLNTVWAIVNVYAGHLQFVREGMEAVITTLSYPNEVFTGKISNLSQVFDPDDKALKARIVLPNADLKLKPEMSVIVRLKDTTQNGLVAIPSEALIFDNDAYFVVVENKDSDFVKKEVIPYDSNKDITYLSAGLNEGENVVIKNQLLIYSELKGN
ncbi:MAG: efflux RND transporter periplasmic adaptor subunit [Tannerellaceae bacterium]|jgi:cobalt-zinc-cadmium efflux system membrane fusion protein|nr:efflux RND transporter periplasmic adaptor subunit [Tannerellaceae bacterium]